MLQAKRDMLGMANVLRDAGEVRSLCLGKIDVPRVLHFS